MSSVCDGEAEHKWSASFGSVTFPCDPSTPTTGGAIGAPCDNRPRGVTSVGGIPRVYWTLLPPPRTRVAALDFDGPLMQAFFAAPHREGASPSKRQAHQRHQDVVRAFRALRTLGALAGHSEFRSGAEAAHASHVRVTESYCQKESLARPLRCSPPHRPRATHSRFTRRSTSGCHLSRGTPPATGGSGPRASRRGC